MYNTDGVDALCNAIIEQQAKDYLRIKKQILKGNASKYKLNELQDVKNWFMADSFAMYSPKIEGEYFIKKLDQLAAEGAEIHRKANKYGSRNKNKQCRLDVGS